MASDSVLLAEPAAVPLPASPSFAVNNHPVSTDSMVSIRLSQPSPTLAPADDSASTITTESIESTSTNESDVTVQPPSRRRPSSVRIHTPVDLDTEINGPQADEEVVVFEDDEAVIDTPLEDDDDRISTMLLDARGDTEAQRRESNVSTGSHRSSSSDEVDWEQLDKTEEAAPTNDITDEVCCRDPFSVLDMLTSQKQTAFLLARLEQENNALATNPRVANLRKRESASSKASRKKAQRPPSIQVLKKLVEDPSATPARFSQLPTPPPMTELEFWAALVKDYPQTAQRLPTLTANKIKSGVPPPLRGVVWVSMVGARDSALADDFDRLAEEPSPYDTMIGKDIGRSFPGVEMFKEAGGEGQNMLGRVLKVFSLYDEEIGYCQGLGFLVGPLLMQMGERDAFCVLVKLMEKYQLRSCFMPDLNGLHLRIYQFQSLLDTHMPELAKHLASLAVEAAYLSQWFLSFFAVTCPLPMLFRIYDVIFAEGASETIMRVAMSLMKQNEKKLMGITEFEEVMQLLLGRMLWEPYEGSADDLVDDFVGLTGIVTHETLQTLEKNFMNAKKAGAEPAPRPGFFQDVSAGASRFLGRLWTAHGPSKSQASLIPPTGADGKAAHVRRSPSKQSIAASEVSTGGSTESANNSISTAATAMTRDSNGDALSAKTATPASKDRDLHTQIEDLLAALSETQRDQTLLNKQIETQNEERDEDLRMLRDMLGHVQESNRLRKIKQQAAKANRRRTSPAFPTFPSASGLSSEAQSPDISDEDSARDAQDVIIERVETRLKAHREVRGSVAFDTKQRLRASLVKSKDQLGVEITRATELEHRIHIQSREIDSLRDQLSFARNRIQENGAERRRLEQQITDLKANGSSTNSSNSPDTPGSIWRPESWGSKRASLIGAGNASPTLPASGGLRELHLGKSNYNGPSSEQGRSSTGPPKSPVSHLKPGSQSSIPARGSSLATRSVLATADNKPAGDDTMLVELVAAKTAEAVARQELEEVKGRMEALRKMLSLPPTAQNAVELNKTLGTASSSAAGAAEAQTPKKDQKGNDLGILGQSGAIASQWFSWPRRTPSAASVPSAAEVKK